LVKNCDRTGMPFIGRFFNDATMQRTSPAQLGLNTMRKLPLLVAIGLNLEGYLGLRRGRGRQGRLERLPQAQGSRLKGAFDDCRGRSESPARSSSQRRLAALSLDRPANLLVKVRHRRRRNPRHAQTARSRWLLNSKEAKGGRGFKKNAARHSANGH
jgi:hypothetical protein